MTNEITAFWFYPEYNRFMDENGNVLHDLSGHFNLWELEQWKKTKEYGLLADRNGNICELFYPEYDWRYLIGELEPTSNVPAR